MYKLNSLKTYIIILLGIINYQSQAQSQYDIYSSMMLYFGKYVQWPTHLQSGDFTIGIVGNCPLKGKLESIATAKNINGRKIVVKKIESNADIKGCNIIFFPENKSESISNYKNTIKSENVLCVSEGDGNLSKGSVFNFIEADGKVKFEYSSNEANTSGLKVSADLVKLAIAK
ncbi:MAG: YfiR family protein [Cytophagales bacterium]